MRRLNFGTQPMLALSPTPAQKTRKGESRIVWLFMCLDTKEVLIRALGINLKT
jgi:hypothetical protein